MRSLNAARVVAALSSLVAVTSVVPSCVTAQGPITCTSCQSDAGVNILSSLPRINRQAEAVSANLGDYHIFSCYGDGTPNAPSSNKSSCVLDLATSTLLTRLQGGTPASTDIVSYAEGIAAYAAFGLVCAIACIVFSTFYCCCRVCCCCVRGGCGCCGKRYPTVVEFPPGYCSRLGFKELEPQHLKQAPPPSLVAGLKALDAMDDAPLNLLNPTAGKRGGAHRRAPHDAAASALRRGGGGGSGPVLLGYSPRARWAVRGCMATYVALVLAFATTGQISGNLGLTQSMRTIAASPASLVATARGLAGPLREAVTALAADAVAPLLSSVANLIQGAVEVDAAAASAQCVVSGVRGGLPDASAMLAFVAAANATLVAAQSASGALQVSMGAATAGLAATLPLIAQAQDTLSAFAAAGAGLNASPAVAAGPLAAMQGYTATLQSQATGLPVAARDLGNVSAYMPPQAAAVAAASGAPNSLAALQALSLNGNANAPGRAALLAQLTALARNVTLLPNLTTTASELAALNAQIDFLRGNRTVDALVASLAAFGASLAAVQPLPGALNASVGALQAAMRGAGPSLAAIAAALQALNASLAAAALPAGGAAVTAQLARLDGVSGILACMSALVAQMWALNATVVALPGALSAVAGLVASANSSYTAARAQVAGFSSVALAAATNATAAGALPNVSAYLALVGTTQAQLAAPPVSVAAIQAPLAAVAASAGALNVSALITGLQALNASVWDPNVQVPAATLGGLRALQPLLAALNATLAAAVEDLAAYSGALHCAGLPTPCAAPGAGNGCGAGTCEAGVNVCAADGSTACTADSACAAGTACLFHASVHAAAAAALQAYAAAGPDAVVAAAGPSTASVAAAAGAIAAVPSVATFSGSIAGLLSSLGAVAVPADASVAALAALAASLDPSALGLGGLNASLAGLQAALGSAGLGSVAGPLAALQVAVASVQAQAAPGGALATASNAAAAASAFFDATLPAVLQQLSRPSLAALPDLGSVLLQVAAAAQSVVAFAGNVTGSTGVGGSSSSSGGGGGSGLLSLNVTGIVAGYLGYVSLLTDPTAAAAGSVYFISQLPFLNLKTVGPAEAAASGGNVFFTSAGSSTRWSGSRYCLTDACIGSTITSFNTQPLALQPGTFGGGLSFSLPLSREALFALPYASPLVVALLGLCGAAGSFRGKRWQRWPACLSACGACCLLPWVFLLVGALAFPLVMAAADACRGGFNVGYKYIAGSQAAICALLPGSAFLPGRGCQVTAQGQSVLLDIPGVYGALLGSCGAFPGAVPGVFAQLQALAGRLPGTFVNSSVVGGALPVTPLPPLLAALTAFGANAGTAAAAFVGGVGGVLSCEALNSGVGALVGGVCCDMMTSLYWLVASWYLIAFSMCLCGFGASVLGYKRFPNALWGPEHDEQVRAAAAASAAAAAAAAAVPGAGATNRMFSRQASSSSRFAGGGGGGGSRRHVGAAAAATAANPAFVGSIAGGGYGRAPGLPHGASLRNTAAAGATGRSMRLHRPPPPIAVDITFNPMAQYAAPVAASGLAAAAAVPMLPLTAPHYAVAPSAPLASSPSGVAPAGAYSLWTNSGKHIPVRPHGSL